jgi:hypothetical protein
MEASLSIQAADLHDEDVQSLAFEMYRAINTETDAEARFPEETPAAGTKGAMAAIGALVLKVLTGETVGALVGVLKSFVERHPTMELELERPDGKKMKLSGRNLRSDQIATTRELAREFFDGA